MKKIAVTLFSLFCLFSCDSDQKQHRPKSSKQLSSKERLISTSSASCPGWAKKISVRTSTGLYIPGRSQTGLQKELLDNELCKVADLFHKNFNIDKSRKHRVNFSIKKAKINALERSDVNIEKYFDFANLANDRLFKILKKFDPSLKKAELHFYSASDMISESSSHRGRLNIIFGENPFDLFSLVATMDHETKVELSFGVRVPLPIVASCHLNVSGKPSADGSEYVITRIEQEDIIVSLSGSKEWIYPSLVFELAHFYINQRALHHLKERLDIFLSKYGVESKDPAPEYRHNAQSNETISHFLGSYVVEDLKRGQKGLGLPYYDYVNFHSKNRLTYGNLELLLGQLEANEKNVHKMLNLYYNNISEFEKFTNSL